MDHSELDGIKKAKNGIKIALCIGLFFSLYALNITLLQKYTNIIPFGFVYELFDSGNLPANAQQMISVLLYVLMLILAWKLYKEKIVPRLDLLISDIESINELKIATNVDTINTIEEIIPKIKELENTSSLSYKFISSALKTRSLEVLTIIKKSISTESENDANRFIYSVERINGWIIRLGIFGTLYGIMLAFHDAADKIAVDENIIGNDVLVLELMKGIKEAILSNAISVVTSLVAHSFTLSIEYSLKHALDVNPTIDWVQNKYFELCIRSEYNDSLSEKKDRLRKDIDDLYLEISSVKSVLTGVNVRLKQKNSFNDVLSRLDALDSSLEKFEYYITSNTTTVIIKLTLCMNNLDLLLTSLKKDNIDTIDTILAELTILQQRMSTSIADLQSGVESSASFIKGTLTIFKKTISSLQSLPTIQRKDESND